MDAIILGVKFLRSAMTCQSFLPSINILKNLNTSFNADYVAYSFQLAKSQSPCAQEQDSALMEHPSGWPSWNQHSFDFALGPPFC